MVERGCGDSRGTVRPTVSLICSTERAQVAAPTTRSGEYWVRLFEKQTAEHIFETFETARSSTQLRDRFPPITVLSMENEIWGVKYVHWRR